MSGVNTFLWDLLVVAEDHVLLNGVVMLNQPGQHHVGSAQGLDFREPIPASGKGGKKTTCRQLRHLELHDHVHTLYLFTVNIHNQVSIYLSL